MSKKRGLFLCLALALIIISFFASFGFAKKESFFVTFYFIDVKHENVIEKEARKTNSYTISNISLYQTFLTTKVISTQLAAFSLQHTKKCIKLSNIRYLAPSKLNSLMQTF